MKEKPPLLRYGMAVLATAAAVLLRLAVGPFITESRSVVPFITFFPAVLLASRYGGFRPGALSIVLSALSADYFFIQPERTFRIPDRGDQLALLIFVLVGLALVLLGHSQRQAVARAEREAAQPAPKSDRATGETDLSGKLLDEVFHIVNEFTRKPVENPVEKMLRASSVVGLANHTVLIALDGTEIPIDDSAAPIRDEKGAIHGTVLVFRDITARRRADASTRLLASVVESSDDGIITKDTNGIVTSWNKGVERIFGYSAEEMIGKPIARIAPADRADEMPAIGSGWSQR